MPAPLVTVICLCYNHQRFVVEAIESVLQQTYPHIELIILDDRSTDESVSTIKQFIADKPEIKFIAHQINQGNCASFNEAFKLAQGDFIIDLAADDVLLPDRVTQGVMVLQEAGDEYGVHFSDAALITEEGALLYSHSDRFPHHTIPQGDIYKEVIRRYFICSPTVMYRRATVEELHGYDETLAFEDFDFWIRSSRKFKYAYSPLVLIKKRIVNNSMSQRQFTKSSNQRWSTLEVCKKIKLLNQSTEEDAALKIRLHYEIGLSLKLFDFKLALRFLKLRISL